MAKSVRVLGISSIFAFSLIFGLSFQDNNGTIEPSSSTWQSSQSGQAEENTAASFDFEYTTNWSTGEQGPDPYDNGFGINAPIYNGDIGEFYRWNQSTWGPGTRRGHHLVFRSINTETTATNAVISAESIDFDYTGDSDDFSWYLANRVGTCLNGSEADRPTVVYYGNSLDEINLTNGYSTLESVGGTGAMYNTDPNRFHMCFILEANDTINSNEENILTMNITPHVETISPDNPEWGDPEQVQATIRNR